MRWGRLGRWLPLFLMLSASSAEAQEPAGRIDGTVTDETGAKLPGVTVEAHATGIGGGFRIAVSDRAGSYSVEELPDASYDLTFRLPGFAGSIRRGVPISRGDRQHVDAVLTLCATADVVVTGKKTVPTLADIADAGVSLIGIASAASQGTVSGIEIDQRPIQRPGEVLETVPGLVISQHSGEGKANQYYLRGFNLDHGTDFATSVAGIPVNLPSHAHGQGYSDLNFLIPELVSGVQYSKGPYRADQGDFSTAGSAAIQYVNSLDRSIGKVDSGLEGYGRALLAQSSRVGGGTLLSALEVLHNDGPWVTPDRTRKYNGVLRYSREEEDSDFSITAMGYQNKWSSTDQVPERAVSSGRISRFGAIDPSDGGETHRYSLSADWQRNGADSSTRISAYAIDYSLRLFSNFTYFLDDPVNGDQFEQADRRVVTGLKANRQWSSPWLGRETHNTLGIQIRNDNVAQDGLFSTREREVLDTVRLDHVVETSFALYGENSLIWSEKIRTVAGLRADYYRFRVRSDNPANSGDDHAFLLSPKLSVILGPWGKTEVYVNAGYGFHSNDARGATITQDPKTRQAVDRVTPLVRAKSAEIGLRTNLIPSLETTVSLWGLGLASELVFAGDAGTTEPSRPSRRTGIEIANRWSPLPGLLFDADLARSSARFTDSGPNGDRVPGAVETVFSAGVSLEERSGLSGSLRLRYFGPRPLIEDDSVRSESSMLVSARLGYGIAGNVRLALDVFNVFNSGVSDVDYFYASRLPGEPAQGIRDIHTHPGQPRTARLGLSYSF